MGTGAIVVRVGVATVATVEVQVPGADAAILRTTPVVAVEAPAVGQRAIAEEPEAGSRQKQATGSRSYPQASAVIRAAGCPAGVGTYIADSIQARVDYRLPLRLRRHPESRRTGIVRGFCCGIRPGAVGGCCGTPACDRPGICLRAAGAGRPSRSYINAPPLVIITVKSPTWREGIGALIGAEVMTHKFLPNAESDVRSAVINCGRSVCTRTTAIICAVRRPWSWHYFLPLMIIESIGSFSFVFNLIL